MRGNGGLCGLAAVLAAGAAAAQSKPPVVTNPDWLRRPSGEDLAEHFPALASRLEIEGRATVSCVVDAEGRLKDCKVSGEAPVGLGFGAATLAMTPLFRMKPQTLNGKPVDGGEVRIPIRFTLPKGDRPAALAEAAAPEAMRQALRVVDAMEMTDKTLQEIAKLDAAASPGASSATVAAAMEAIRKAGAAHRGELREAYGRAFASVFSEEEMAGIADYLEGPGKRMGESPALNAIQAQNRNDYRRNLRTAARAAFCATAACGTAAELDRVWRPADPRDKRLDNPQWATAPSAFLVRRTAPALADAIGLTGAVRLTCTLDGEGRPQDCAVDEELPKGLGYGAAALKVAGDYRLSPIQLEAGAKGRRVTVRVGFTPSESPAAGKAPEPRSPRALELARQIVLSDEESAAAAKRDVEVEILKFQSPKPKDVDARTYDAAIEAYRTGAATALGTFHAAQAAGWASVHDDADLAALAAFRASPGFKAQSERREALGVVLAKAVGHVGGKINDEARAAFCSTRGCDPKGVLPPQPSDAVSPGVPAPGGSSAPEPRR